MFSTEAGFSSEDSLAGVQFCEVARRGKFHNSAPQDLMPSQRSRGALDEVDASMYVRGQIGDLGEGKLSRSPEERFKYV